MRDGRETEVMVYVCWDKELREYVVSVPMQKVSKAHISVVIPPDEAIDPDRYIHVADIHSHNSMPAFFSKTDDRDELATRVYIVVGRLDCPTPAIRARISVGGRFVPIDVRQVVDIPDSSLETTMDVKDGAVYYRARLLDSPEHCSFPPDWLAPVSVESITADNTAAWDYPELPEYNRSFLLHLLTGLHPRRLRFKPFGERTVQQHEIR
jgi:hypothetical protein